jgi:hypothetical protein
VAKDQNAKKEYPRGLKCKDQTSYEKTPYLGREADIVKMMQLKGIQVQNGKRTNVEEGATEPSRSGLGPVGPSEPT